MKKFLPYSGGSHLNGSSFGLVESMFRHSLRNQERYYQPEGVKLVRGKVKPRSELSPDELKALAWDDEQPMQFDENGKEIGK